MSATPRVTDHPATETAYFWPLELAGLGPPYPPLLTVRQTAQILGISLSATYRAIRAGQIPFVRIGRGIRVPTAALLAMFGLPLSEYFNGPVPEAQS